MSKIGKISFVICGLSLFILFAARLIIGGWIDILYAPLVFALISFIGAFAFDIRYYFEFFTMKTTKQGMNMGTLILCGLALIAVINYFSIRYNRTWDLTQEQLFSLSEQSEKVVEDLESTVDVKVFYRGEEDFETRENIRIALENYLSSTDKINVQFINALINPGEAEGYLSANDEVKVFAVVGEKKVEIDQPYGETQITSALIRVNLKESQTIYFLSGHGEADIDLDNLEGLSELATALRSNGFQVAKINLLNGDRLEDIDGVLAIVGPNQSLLESELQSVRAFMQRGGKLFLALDPGRNHQMALLTKPLGIEFRNNFLINERVQLLNASPATILGVGFDRSSDITRSFAQTEQFALFMLASELSIADDVSDDWKVTELVKTVPSAYAMNDLNAKIDPETISRRQHGLGYSLVGQQDSGSEFRMVAFGDSDFLSNRVIFNGINRELALNSFAFLVKDAGLINVTPKIAEGTKMTMTYGGQLAAVTGGVVLPLILIIISGILWIRRKNQ